MRTQARTRAIVAATLALALPAMPGAAEPTPPPKAAKADPISGEWAASFELEGTRERGTMALAGALEDGMLRGDWDVGHAKGRWSAKKKLGEKRQR